MRHALIGLVSFAMIAASAGIASANEEGVATGVATGAIAGAVVGGPIGAIVGAGIGAIAGEATSEAANPQPEVVMVPATEATGSVPCISKTVRTQNSRGQVRTVTTESCD